VRGGHVVQYEGDSARMVDACVDIVTFGGGVSTGSSTLCTETQQRGGYPSLILSVWNETQHEGRGACVCKNKVLSGCPCKHELPHLCVCKGGRAHVSRLSPQGGQARVRATVGWLVLQERAPQVVVL